MWKRLAFGDFRERLVHRRRQAVHDVGRAYASRMFALIKVRGGNDSDFRIACRDADCEIRRLDPGVGRVVHRIARI
jgi:hypothetical protein